MIIVEFTLPFQRWRVNSQARPGQYASYLRKEDAMHLAKQMVGAHIIVIDPRFAYHPTEVTKFISEDGARTFHKMYCEQLAREGTTNAPSFEDWAANHLDMEIPK